MKDWTHKVVKKQRGMHGEWFDHATAFTGTESECREYAERFARNQAGVPGTVICVRTRGGKPFAEYPVSPTDLKTP